MDVLKRRFDESLGPDANGNYEFAYSGVIYTLSTGGLQVVARRYDDDSSVAILIEPLICTDELLDSAPMREILTYLKTEGIVEVETYNPSKGSFERRLSVT